MGILDDAIRQHLDLKRRLGAGEDELARLEDEAFGLPTRPGDPDFPDTGSEQAQPAEGEAVAPPAADAVMAESSMPAATPPATGEEPITELPAKPMSSELEDPPEAPVDQAPPPVDTGEQPVTPPIPGIDTVEHDISTEADSDELDLDLDDDEENGESRDEPPIESPDTVEHEVDGALEDTGEAEVVEGELESPPAGGSDSEVDEDVLEETPEFLRDQPEDDELWFEQGEPKDFDF